MGGGHFMAGGHAKGARRRVRISQQHDIDKELHGRAAGGQGVS